MAVIGCYSLDLYCDMGDDPYGVTCRRSRGEWGDGAQGQYTGHTEGDCIKQARSDGWTFNRDKTKAFCPICSKKRH